MLVPILFSHISRYIASFCFSKCHVSMLYATPRVVGTMAPSCHQQSFYCGHTYYTSVGTLLLLQSGQLQYKATSHLLHYMVTFNAKNVVGRNADICTRQAVWGNVDI